MPQSHVNKNERLKCASFWGRTNGNLVAGCSCARLCDRSYATDRVIVGGGNAQGSTLIRRYRRNWIIATGSWQWLGRHWSTIVPVAIAVAILIAIVVVRLITAVIIKLIAIRAMRLFVVIMFRVQFRWRHHRLQRWRFFSFLIEFRDDVKLRQWLSDFIVDICYTICNWDVWNQRGFLVYRCSGRGAQWLWLFCQTIRFIFNHFAKCAALNLCVWWYERSKRKTGQKWNVTVWGENVFFFFSFWNCEIIMTWNVATRKWWMENGRYSQ